MDKQARDILMLGSFFLVYGALLAVAHGVRVRFPRVLVDGIDSRKLMRGMNRRDELLRQEGIEDIPEATGVANPNPETE